VATVLGAFTLKTILRASGLTAALCLICIRLLQAEPPLDESETQQKLRNAVAEYQQSVESAKGQLADIIDRLLREAAGKGDLEKAQQYRSAKTNLARGAAIPDLPGLKVGLRTYAVSVGRAKAKCEQEFDEVIKLYTKSMHLDAAASIRRTKETMFAKDPGSSPPALPDRVSKALGRSRGNVSLFFSFEDDDLGKVADGSSFGNNGLSHECTTQADTRHGKTLGLGATSYVEVASSPSLNPPAITVAAWVNPTSPIGNIVSKDDWDKSAPKGYVLRLGRNGVVDFTVGGNQWQSCGTTSAIPMNTWTYLVATCDASGLRIYVNGKPAAAAPLQGPVSSSPLPLNIGWCPFDKIRERKFEGRIDDVLILNTAAPPDVVLKLFEMSK